MITYTSPRQQGLATPPATSMSSRASPERKAIRRSAPGGARAAAPVDASSPPRVTMLTSAQASGS
eukprot:3671180-Pyramimonas_sp.AAC.1